MVDDNSFMSSQLGTKEYWEKHYTAEITNFRQNRDEGDVWFGSRPEKEIIKFLLSNVSSDSRIVDLGTGNASLLRKLSSHGFKKLCGVDYSERAIDLARNILQGDSEFGSIELLVADICQEHTDDNLLDQFAVVLDKGTFDAISLSQNSLAKKNNYKKNIKQMFCRKDGKMESHQYFIIVSCNFTKEELVEFFEDEDLCFSGELQCASTFVFGGKNGQTTVGCIFKLIPSPNK